MKQSNYFDFDGNIESSYSSLSFLGDTFSKGENVIESEKLEYAPSAFNVPSAEPVIPSVSDDALSAPAEPLSSEVTAALEAFEHMNLSREELHKELDQKRAEKEALEPPKPKREKKEQKKEKPKEEKPKEEKAPEEAKEEKPEKEEKKKEDKKEELEAAREKIKETVKKVGKKREKKEVSRLKHFFIIVLLFILLIAVFTGVVYIFMRSINKENDRANKFNKNAAQVCSDYSSRYGNINYENLYDLYKVEGCRLTGLCFVRELDFDDDGESELMLVYNKNGKYYNEVWGYGSEKQFKMLYSDAAAQTDNKADDAYSLLYHSKNKYYIAKFDKDDLNKFTLMQFRRNAFSKKFDGEYEIKTKAYSVDGKDDTDAFERIRYSVLKEEKASAQVDEISSLIESFNRNSEGVDSPQETQTLENAYYQIVLDYNKKYGVCKFVKENGVAYMDGLAVVDLVDFDGDGKKELVLVYRKPVKVRDESSSGENVTYEVDRYYCDIYRYSGSKAILTYTNEGLSNKSGNTSDIYYIIRNEKKKAYYCLNSFTVTDYGHHINAVSSEYKFDGPEFVSTFKASYNTDYGYTEYYLEGKYVSHSEFESTGYKNPFFDGGRDYDKKKYKVTYVQRKSADAGDLSGMEKQTERNIQSLNQLYSADIKK